MHPDPTSGAAREPSGMSDDMVSVTMTRDAALMLFASLIWAVTAARDAGRREEAEWLTWGAGRVAQATPSTEGGPDAP